MTQLRTARLTRMLGVLLGLMLAVQPALACCVTGHAEAGVDAESTPCHGDHEAPQPEPADCPGCSHCGPVMSQAVQPDMGDRMIVWPELEAIENDAQLPAAAREGPILDTGPPLNPDPPLRGILAVTQRLRI